MTRPLRIAVVEHHGHENVRTLFHDWAERNGYAEPVVYNASGKDQELPDHRKYDVLIYMGGTPNLHEIDQHPWISREQALMRQAAQAGKIQLGICFGSQNMAAAFGGGVHQKARPVREWDAVTLTANGKKSKVFPRTPEAIQMLLNHEYGPAANAYLLELLDNMVRRHYPQNALPISYSRPGDWISL